MGEPAFNQCGSKGACPQLPLGLQGKKRSLPRVCKKGVALLGDSFLLLTDHKELGQVPVPVLCEGATRCHTAVEDPSHNQTAHLGPPHFCAVNSCPPPPPY